MIQMDGSAESGPGGGSSLPVTDDFNRANDAAALGTASDGSHLWITHLGVMGINANRGYIVSKAVENTFDGGISTVDAGTGDCTIEVTLPTMFSSAQQSGIIFRYSDNDNFWVAYLNWFADTLHVYHMQAGVFSSVTAVASTVANGDVLKVVTRGDTYWVYVNDILKIGPRTSSHNQTATRHGVGGFETLCRWDDFSVSAWTPPPPTWAAVVGATESPAGVLTKTASGGWGNAGAVSNETMTGDCRLTLYVEDLTKEYFAGVDPATSCATYSGIDFGVHCNVASHGEVAVWENGGLMGSLVLGLTGSDKVMVVIERIGTSYDYYYLEYSGARPQPDDAGRIHARGPATGTGSPLLVNVALEVNPDGRINAADVGWEAI